MIRSTDAEQELELVVAEADSPASDVRRLVLRRPDGGELPVWTPGAHVDLHLGDLTRQYSLCGDPTDRTQWSVAVLREADGRGGSTYVHDKVEAGETVTVRGPRNHFPLVPSPRYVFVAGGIGITPILPMVAEAEAAGADWVLHYGGRTRGSMAFADELVERYADRVQLHPHDETGLLDLAAILGGSSDDSLVYCCGPEPLLVAVGQGCAAWPEGSLHVEHFSPKEVVSTGADEAFEVELSESGRTLTVPADRSVLAVLEEAGVGILSSCTEGTCGTCETGVLGGEVEHRDSLLSPAEQEANDVMFVCVSRARHGCPKLVLEL